MIVDVNGLCLSGLLFSVAIQFNIKNENCTSQTRMALSIWLSIRSAASVCVQKPADSQCFLGVPWAGGTTIADASTSQVWDSTAVELHKGKGKGKCIAVCINTYTATGNHLPYGITQCYLPSGRGDFPLHTTPHDATVNLLLSLD